MAQQVRPNGLAAIARVGANRRRRVRGAPTTTAPSNQKSQTATKGIVGQTTRPQVSRPGQRSVSQQPSPTAPTQNPARPETLVQSQQTANTQQATAEATDTRDFMTQLNSITNNFQTPGMFNSAQKKAQNDFMQQVKAAQEGGVSRAELEQLKTSLGSQQFRKHEKGAQGFQSSTMGQLDSLLAESASPTEQANAANAPGSNPFLTQSIRKEYRPRVEQIEGQLMTEADQQVQSENAQKDYAMGIDQSVQDTQDRVGQNIEGLQGEARGMHDQFTTERQALSETVAGLPAEIERKFDANIDEFQQRITSSQGIIDQKESAALSQVMVGKSQAMAAAVQGTQGQVNSQIAQINANPSLTDSQKAQMTAQVRMQGAASIGPQVGATVLQFNELAANTAVAFGNMTTQIQGTGLQGMASLYEAEAKSFAETNIAAAQLGAQLLQTQSNADNNYITAQSNLEATRANIDMMGDQLRASLIPEMGVPYPQYSNAMMTGLQMDFDLAKQEFQGIMGQYGFQMAAWQAQQQAKGGFFQSLAAIGSTMGGPMGQGLMGLGMLGGGMAAGNASGTMPQLPGGGGYSTASNANSFGLDMPRIG